MSEPRLALVYQTLGWEEKELLRRAEARGVRTLALATSRLALGPTLGPTLGPGLGSDCEPKGETVGGTVFLVRVASFFQATAVARWLESLGHPVLNSSRDLALCGEKHHTDLWLHEHGLPAIPSITLFGAEGLAAAGERLGWPLVAKPSIGGGGRLVHRIDGPRELAQSWELVASYAPASHRMLYLQRHLAVRRDLRVVLLGGRVLAAVERRHPHRLAQNVADGGGAAPSALGPRAAGVAAELGRLLPTSFLGVDLLEDEAGEIHVCELNAVCRFRATSAAAGVDVAGAVIDFALAQAATRSLRPVA